MAPNFGQATASNSPWLKSNDVPGGLNGQQVVTVERAYMDWYDQKGTEEAYVIKLREFPKPLGCNVTNRRAIQNVIGAADEDPWESIPVGQRFTLFKVQTQDREGKPVEGLRIGAPPSAPSERQQQHAASDEARARIEAAQASQGVQGAESQGKWSAAEEPPGFVDDQDPGAQEPF